MNHIDINDAWVMYSIPFEEEGKINRENFWALRNVSLSVARGECVAVLGENGAGKTTLLKLIAGLLKADRGTVQVSGSVAGLLELGAGFQPELTGKDNVYALAGLFGLSKEQTAARFEQIVSFADIGRFIHAPVKCYSQGMLMRLAFSAAIHVCPDILLIDDALAVGDAHFQRKCVQRVCELNKKGVTVILACHDSTFLRNMCSRAIMLRQGRVITDGSVERAVALYAKTKGMRKGVGLLESGAMQIVFNNGRVYVLWNGVFLTADAGLHALVKYEGEWLNSAQARWEVLRQNERCLTATGVFVQVGVSEIWKIALDEDQRLRIDIALTGEELATIDECVVTLLLTDRYQHWFTSLDKGVFPDLGLESAGWQPLLPDGTASICVGVDAVHNCGIKYPAIVFEGNKSGYERRIQIYSGDYAAKSRALQFKVFQAWMPTAMDVETIRIFNGQIVVNVQDISAYLSEVQEISVLRKGNLKMCYSRGKFQLYYRDTPVTKAQHVATVLVARGREYYSEHASWQLEEVDNNSLVVKGVWQGLPLVQVWRLRINDDDSFDWTVEFELFQPVAVQEQYLRFSFSERYEYFQSEYGRGLFPEDFAAYEIDLLQRCVSAGTIELYGGGADIPGVMIDVPAAPDVFAKIFHSDCYRRTREIRIMHTEPESGAAGQTNRARTFCAKVSLRQVNYEAKNKQAQEWTGKAGDLRMEFSRGCGRIYARGRELTKRLGFYTAARYQGRWFDSQAQALWSVISGDDFSVETRGKWMHLPVEQRWYFCLREERNIDFKIIITAKHELTVDRLQVNLMLSELYPEWIAPKERGEFTPFLGAVSDDWQVQWNQEENNQTQQCVAVTGGQSNGRKLPEVYFAAERLMPRWRAQIVNSDLYHRGRVLRYLDEGPQAIIPGQQTFLEGTITIKI